MQKLPSCPQAAQRTHAVGLLDLVEAHRARTARQRIAAANRTAIALVGFMADFADACWVLLGVGVVGTGATW